MSCNTRPARMFSERFQIPMRGNEYRCGGLESGYGDRFQIPMRGNESITSSGSSLKDSCFKST